MKREDCDDEKNHTMEQFAHIIKQSLGIADIYESAEDDAEIWVGNERVSHHVACYVAFTEVQFCFRRELFVFKQMFHT